MADGGQALRWSLLVRWAMRWLPFALLGIAGFAVMVVVDALVAWRRTDARSLSDLAARTVSVSQRSVMPPL